MFPQLPDLELKKFNLYRYLIAMVKLGYVDIRKKSVFNHRTLPASKLLYAQGRTKVSDNLYFKSAMFKSNKSLAEYVFSELKKLNLNPEPPIDSDYMFSITMNIDEDIVDLYLGENDEKSETPLWQIWPEQRISFFKKLFSNFDKSSELKARQIVESIARNIEGVTDVEWGI